MSEMTYYSLLDSPLGELFLRGDGQALTGLYMPRHKHWTGLEAGCQRADEFFVDVREQLAEYFAGQRRVFDVPVRLSGTPFQRQVWQELQQIPFGVTISYAELAARIGQPNASRAVGSANGRNPVSIIVPCHRVIGANGALTGYGGGLHNKSWLLDWEQGRGGERQARMFDDVQTSKQPITQAQSAAVAGGSR